MFKLFDDDKDGYLSFSELSSHLTSLYFGDFEDTAFEIFSIYDFDSDGKIAIDDVKVILCFLPLKEDKTKNEYKYQLESLSELDLILKHTFGSKKELYFDDFVDTILVNSDVYLQLLCYLYHKCPFLEMNVRGSSKNVVKPRQNTLTIKVENTNYKKLMFSPTSPKKKISTGNDRENIHMNSPSHKTVLSPVRDFLKNSTCKNANYLSFNINGSPVKNFNANQSGSTADSFKFEYKSDYKPVKITKEDLTKLYNKECKEIKETKEIKEKKTKDIKKEEEQEKPLKCGKLTFRTPKKHDSFSNTNSVEVSGSKGVIKTSNTKFTDEKIIQQPYVNTTRIPDNSGLNTPTSKGSKILTTSKLFIQEKKDEIVEKVEKVEEEDEAKNIVNEGYLFYLEEDKDKPKLYYVVLIGHDIRYYKDERMTNILEFHTLNRCFIKENGAQMIKNTKYYSFSIIFENSKQITFLSQEKSNAKEWTQHIRTVIGYKSFFEYYEIIDELGQGAYGAVKLGVNKETKSKVAIKIVEKNKLKKGELDLVKKEIDILSLCKHPNIVIFYETFENSEYIFIVTEYIKGGNLKYFTSHHTMTEKEIYSVLIQLIEALSYLHNFGIVHRDIKPENVMIANYLENKKFEIKLLDFGLSTILSPNETTTEKCGTMYYMSPEVLQNIPYNKSVDVWSVGVLLYVLASSEYPFDNGGGDEFNPVNKKEIANQILTSPVNFPTDKFKKFSKKFKDFITKCLVKDSDKRITIEGIYQNDWVKSMAK